ncbi:MAG: hypothetical protein ACLP7O_00335 [Terracidiphilus sp.]
MLLIDSYVDSIADPAKQSQTRAEVEKASSIFRKYTIFQRQFAASKSKLPRDLSEDMDSLFSGVFNLIRNSRNDAGHPATATLISRDDNYTRLRLFVPYCQRIYALIAWLNANPT